MCNTFHALKSHQTLMADLFWACELTPESCRFLFRDALCLFTLQPGPDDEGEFVNNNGFLIISRAFHVCGH